MMQDVGTTLTMRNLSIGYPGKEGEDRLFEKLNLQLPAGELVCFMGPNGAGKSSLLRTLAGLQRPLSGEVDIRPNGGRGSSAKAIAVVLTDPLYSVNLTVEEVITFGRYPYLGWDIRLSDKDRQIITAAVDQVRIAHLRGRKVYELSDGQLQMVMIARALAQDTPIILLDEPTAHLDLNNRLEIMNLLCGLTRDTGRSILVATHELDLALQTADRIWLTGKNRDILTGLPEDLVLNGAFDEIFQFKGFDLKTGKVLHRPFRNVGIDLRGEGSALRWTRNAFERNGYRITRNRAALVVTLVEEDGRLKWMAEGGGVRQEAESLQEILIYVNKRLQ